jgi:hypothetical protein
VGNWEETDPPIPSIAFDEYDPNSPKLQILFVNGDSKSVWITRNIYRVEHSCKLSIFVRPVNAMSTSIDAAKATFLAIKVELDRILNLKFGITGIQATELSGWKDTPPIEVGRDLTGKGQESIISEQVIKTIYYVGAFE